VRRAVHAVALLGLVLAPTVVLAQQWPEAGERVRVRHVDGRMFTGRVESTLDDELRLGGPGGPYVLPRSDIAGMERSLGERRSFGRAFVATIGLTAGGGAVIGAVAWSPCAGDCWFHPRTRGDAMGWGLVGGAVLGVPLAVLVGVASKSERWGPVPTVGPVALSAVVHPERGAGLRASIYFGQR
jgi:hypothetical protein